MADRRAPRSLGDGLRPLLPLVPLWLAGSTVLAALIGQGAVPSEQLLLDPNSYNRLPWYAGMVSNLGILGWTTASVAAAGGAWIGRLGDRRPATELLRGGSLLSILLLLDDLFQLHIVVAKTLNADKTVFYGVYLALGAWWAATNHRELLRTRWPLLLAAATALAGSALTDQIGPRTETGLVIEDSLKFLGILAWAQYFVMTGRDIARSVVDERAVDERAVGERADGSSATPARSAELAGR